jgi:hypothetical protein
MMTITSMRGLRSVRKGWPLAEGSERQKSRRDAGSTKNEGSANRPGTVLGCLERLAGRWA